jgi:hypothetical protein
MNLKTKHMAVVSSVEVLILSSRHLGYLVLAWEIGTRLHPSSEGLFPIVTSLLYPANRNAEHIRSRDLVSKNIVEELVGQFCWLLLNVLAAVGFPSVDGPSYLLAMRKACSRRLPPVEFDKPFHEVLP